MAGERRSRREVIRRRRQAGFVGRRGELAAFRDNLARGVEHDDYQFVFHVSGNAGVGKTALVGQWERLAVERGAVTVTVEDEVHGPIEAMEAMARRLRELGHPLKDFEKRLAHYRRLYQEVAASAETADHHAPGGTSMASGVLARAGLAGLGLLPGGGLLAGALDAEELAQRTDRLRAALGARLKGAEDAALVLDPVRELTPVLVREVGEVAEDVPWVVLVFDTYERTAPVLDDWVRELVLGGRFGELPLNVLVVLAGQDQLDARRWRDGLDHVHQVALDVFTEEEARALLAARGVTEESVVRAVLRLTERLPVLVALLAQRVPDGAEEVADLSETAVDLFLRWETDPARRETALACALPTALDEDVYGVVAGQDAGDYAWLRSLPFVNESAGRARYHDVVRSPMLRLLRTQSPSRWRELHLRLADAYRGWREELEETLPSHRRWDHARWQELRIEETYHRLCAVPHEELPGTIGGVAHACAHGVDTRRRWARLLARAGADAGEQEIAGLGERLLAVAGSDVELLTVLLDTPHPGAGTRAEIRAQRGRARVLAGDPAGAVEDLTAVLAVRPDHRRALLLRARARRQRGQLDLALADCTEALRRAPDDANAHAERGDINHLLGRREMALADYGRAIAARPDLGWAHAHRGHVHLELARVDEALADYERALSIRADDACALEGRARVSLHKGRLREAVDDFDRALEARPNHPSALAGRALARLTLGELSEARADTDQAIRLDPHWEQPYLYRGMVLFSLGRPWEALPDVDRALRATPHDTGALAIRSEIHLLLGDDAEALADLDRLLEVEPDEAWALACRAQVRLIAGDLGEALGDVERALARQPGHAGALVIAGVAHRLAGRTAEAEAHWARALTRLTEETAEGLEDFEPWGNLFLLHCVRRDEESAVAARRGFLAAEPEPGSLQQWLAALDRYRRILDLDPDWVAELARPLRARLSEGGGGA
ncbi:tetratricopeptide repeat protein [Streptomyces triticirhizae]|uniref:Uncharacterized protein n=1 Tax=Streptomyces triticirhizae TaxID=2483353 RepID=A0A3M2MAZ7_9ACTN|nr:tetratricopeptide repeat protein [Streptomyces triticirhizae]RMI46043.1 hypothetical protein EBN88_01815 [Streptomyces triticirhizae]